MRKCFAFLLIALVVVILPDNNSVAKDNVVIKSLQVYPGSKKTAFPVVYESKGKSTLLTIEFDVQSDSPPELALVFKFCDRNFNPYSSVFLVNNGKNIQMPLIFKKLNPVIQGADYHYRGTFPNDNVTFPFAGKWMFFITSQYDTSVVYNYGYFYVAETNFNLSVSLTRSRSEDEISDNTEYDRTAEMRIGFKLPNRFDPYRVKFVEVIRNRVLFYPMVIPKTGYNKDRYFEWNGTDEFTFIMKDLKPGNEYRHVDFRNEDKYFGPNLASQIRHLDLSRFYQYGGSDLNGAEILTNYNDDYADYYYIPFDLRLPDNFNKHVYLVGSFTDWEILPSFEMQDDNGVYQIEVELKRGRYDYQYVTSEKEFQKTDKFDWIELEGNFWKTENEYHIFVFYDSPDLGGYDKIIAVKGFSIKVKSGK